MSTRSCDPHQCVPVKATDSALAGMRQPLLILLILPALVFAQLRKADFIGYDDPDYVLLEPLVRQGLSATGIYQSLMSYRNSNWHPVTWWSLMLDHSLFGTHAGAYHLHNLALHILNGWLLYYWLRKHIMPAGPSLLVAVLFSIHPLHVEPVAWISSRKDVLSTLFLMGTLCLYGAYSRRPRVATYVAMAGCLVLGMMAKSMLITAPLLLLLIDRSVFASHSFASQSLLRQVIDKIPLFVLAAATAFLTFQAQNSFGAVADATESSIVERICHVLSSYAFYIQKTFAPVGLTLHYPYDPLQLTPARIGIDSAIVMAAVAIGLCPGHNRPLRLLGLGWYVITLLPVCGIVRLGGLAAADRYSYVPLIGLFIVIVSAIPLTLPQLSQSERTLRVLAISTCAALTLMAHRQASYWHNSVTIFQHAVKITPDSDRMQSFAGLALEQQGNLVPAARYLKEAIRLNPEDVLSQCILGKILTEQGQYSEAVVTIAGAAVIDQKIQQQAARKSRVVSDRQRRSAIYYYWGRALSASGNHQQALEKFVEAQSIDPTQLAFHEEAADALMALGRHQDAANEYQQCIDLDPHNTRWKRKLADMFAVPANSKINTAATN